MGKVMILSFSEDEEAVCQRMLQIIKESPHFQDSKVIQMGKYLSVGEIKINLAEKNLVVHGAEVMLTNREFGILYLLAQSPGRIYSREQIYDIVWQEPYSGDYNIVMSHIRHIREKIEDDPGKPLYIQTVWGICYRFNKNLSSSL